MKTQLNPFRSAGFTLTEIMIVVGIIGLLTSIAVPNFARARDNSRVNMIYVNLRAINDAKDRWALENNKAGGTPVPDITILSNYFRAGMVQDVVREIYVANEVGTPAEAHLPGGVSLGTFGAGAVIQSP